MKLRQFCIAIALLSAAAYAQAACGPEVEQALRKFKAKPAIESDIVAQQCKPWPPSAGKVIAAVMAFADPEADEHMGNLPGVLALVDARTHRVVHGRRFTVYEDAATKVGASSFELDTANYALASGVRALGLRFFNASSGPGVAENRRSNELTLFVPLDGELQPIFGLTTEVARAVEGCLGKCRDAVWDEAALTIAVGKPGPKGWRDLVVTARIVRDGTIEPSTWDSAPHQERVIYRYNGNGAYIRDTPGERWWDAYCCTPAWEDR